LSSIVFKVLRFKLDNLTLGDISLTVYKLIEIVEKSYQGDPADGVARLLEEEKRGKSDYVLVECSACSAKISIGESIRRSSGSIVFPRITKLKRVGVVKTSDLEATDQGYYKIKNISWFNINDGIYIYDSLISAPQDTLFIVLDTEDGRRFVKLYSSIPQESSRIQPQQGLSSDSSESLLSGDSTPS